MKFSYKWLRDIVDVQLSAEELQEELTFSGIEVESIIYDYFGEYVNDVVIAEILSTKPHPERDDLYICKVFDGTANRVVVCGAPNCVAGLKTAYIPVGGQLGDKKIEKASFKGVESEGMLCSEKDINLSNEHDGIIELPEEAIVGGSLKEYFDLNDIQYDVEITPNRPDLLGVLGIARDIAAIVDVKLKENKLEVGNVAYNPGGRESPNLVDNQAPDLCTRYTATVIKGVVVGNSPIWLKKRLRAVGVKPVNNLVDITNYIMMKYGHPLHAFDCDLLDEKRIVVRRAKQNETIEALDNNKHSLIESDLLICDASHPVAIAGIIGGTETSITKETKNILLEAANFNFPSVRNTTKRLKINTDSSYRFERNMSDETTAIVSEKAVELILELCGGEVVAYSDSYPEPIALPNVTLRPSRANRLLSTDMSPEMMINYLERLGLKKVSETDDRIEFSIPFFRKDLTREIDLIEELIRIYGYNNVGDKEESLRPPLTDTKRFTTKRKIADLLAHFGYYEVINSSFADKSLLDSLEFGEEDYRLSYIEIINPIGSDSGIMRTSLLPGLLNNTRLNLSIGQSDLKLFELGKIYFQREGMPIEKLFLSGIVSGYLTDHHWKQKPALTDIFYVKGIVELILDELNVDYAMIPKDNLTYVQKGQGVNIKCSQKEVGHFGKLDPLTLKQFEIECPIYFFDINLEDILTYSKDNEITYQPIVRFPAAQRDLSFIVDKKVSHQEIIKTIRETNAELVKEVLLIDEFTGKDISDDFRSLTYRMVIGSNERTLVDNVIQSIVEKAFKTLSEKYNICKR